MVGEVLSPPQGHLTGRTRCTYCREQWWHTDLPSERQVPHVLELQLEPQVRGIVELALGDDFIERYERWLEGIPTPEEPLKGFALELYRARKALASESNRASEQACCDYDSDGDGQGHGHGA